MHLHAHVMELSYDLHGCRVVQCILEHGTDLIRTNVFNQIEPNLLAVIQHRCGNYVIQSAIRKWYSNLFANLSLNSLICLILYRVLSTTLATTFDWLRFGGHNLFVQSQVFIECGRKVHWFGDCSTKTASNGLDLFTWRTVSFVIWVKRRLMFHFILFFHCCYSQVVETILYWSVHKLRGPEIDRSRRRQTSASTLHQTRTEFQRNATSCVRTQHYQQFEGTIARSGRRGHNVLQPIGFNRITQNDNDITIEKNLLLLKLCFVFFV